MDLHELSDLRSGVTLFVGAINEIAKRADCSQAYVTRTLKGETGLTPLTQQVISVAKQYLNEKLSATEQYKGLAQA